MGAARSRQGLEVGGRDVPVTNLDKVLYPSGFTKGKVIDFYIRVSDFLLPHLKGRPLTLKRYPNGISANHFYEKDAPDYTPAWVRRFPVPRRSGEAMIDYVVIDDLASLVWSANLANLEMHPFLHRAPKIDTPTALVFDLDPGEETDILTCAEVAFLLKERLEPAGMQCWVKVSGSKGLQLYAPLNTPVTYAATTPFARALAESLEREHPDMVVSAMAKAKRVGRVFIDWSQNSDFKTTVSPYSLRAKRPSPYVSMPVTWEELKRAKRPADLDFDPEAALARLERTGDIFAPVLRIKQKLPRSVPDPSPARRKARAEP